jgi:mRNA-degrading endonuclease RelE of RelBE toxin-antitoxin system
MHLSKSKHYIKGLIVLSKKDLLLLEKLERLLEEDHFDPRLHTKKLKGFPDDKVFSFRITQSYRGIFRINSQYNSIILFAIGHRKDIYESF